MRVQERVSCSAAREAPGDALLSLPEVPAIGDEIQDTTSESPDPFHVTGSLRYCRGAGYANALFATLLKNTSHPAETSTEAVAKLSLVGICPSLS